MQFHVVLALCANGARNSPHKHTTRTALFLRFENFNSQIRTPRTTQCINCPIADFAICLCVFASSLVNAANIVVNANWIIAVGSHSCNTRLARRIIILLVSCVSRQRHRRAVQKCSANCAPHNVTDWFIRIRHVAFAVLAGHRRNRETHNKHIYRNGFWKKTRQVGKKSKQDVNIRPVVRLLNNKMKCSRSECHIQSLQKFKMCLQMPCAERSSIWRQWKGGAHRITVAKRCFWGICVKFTVQLNRSETNWPNFVYFFFLYSISENATVKSNGAQTQQKHLHVR